MMKRRDFVSGLSLCAAAAFFPRQASPQNLPRARNIVLVHGLFADGSCWSEVIPLLQAAGLDVTGVAACARRAVVSISEQFVSPALATHPIVAIP